ncbi:la-related protein Larp4B-like isoform X2 [Belonocnema kinseyi]|uniref:la-related protein Larp4B-like isoform X2 n=1 Tax=Belonocnema kinseyi TaxID=2817044 RepID=UPI00143DB6F1|nr:la-related protein Larp4B-like isoform X2 [Belonocnema kinseyi]
MNGDIGKLPPGAVYAASPETLSMVGGAVGNSASGLDYGVMNGGPSGGELMLDAGVGSLESAPQLAMGMGAAVGYSPVDIPNLGDVSAPTGQMADLTVPGIPLEQLKQMLSSQLEYYFSRENLANDTYLLSQMDNDQYVPIWTVANFNQVKKLTKDIKLITEVLRESPNVQVDEEGQKVRPNHKRCIVILREIPDNTPLEDVKNLFSGEGCPRFISCEFAHNSSWYVTFESDEDAQKAYRFLREEVREFQGKPIMARIKAKPMNRLPMPAVTGVGGIKNGYRTPPPPPAVYDPGTYPPNPQRFLYTNGTTMPQTTMPPYANQVHVYHQPFYPAGMMPWGAASPAYFDVTTMFTMNGITPHTTYKPHNTRYNQRNRNKRNGPDRSVIGGGSGIGIGGGGNGGGGGGSGGLMDGGGSGGGGAGGMSMARSLHAPLSGGGPVPGGTVPPVPDRSSLPTAKPTSSSYQTGTKFHSSHTANSATGDAPYSSSGHAKGSQESDAQTLDTSAIQFPRHRIHRRTKDQDNTPLKTNSSPQPSSRDSAPASNAQHNRGVQFDLEASAFPPLPGLDADHTKSHNPSLETSTAESLQSQNRLSDVVKGTAKLKSTKELGGIAQQYNQQQHYQQQNQQQYQHQQQQYQHQQQQQHHHHHHHQTSNSSRSTSPGSNVAAGGHHGNSQENNVAGPSISSSAAAATSNSNPSASNSDVQDIALSTVTLTPPSSPDKILRGQVMPK